MMVKVLLYGYAKGTFSSRKLAAKLHEDVALRVLAAENYPAHRTLSDFGALQQELAALLVQVVRPARECGLVDALKHEMLRHSVLHSHETPVATLAPGKKKTHRAYLWAYCPGVFEDLKAVVYDDFAPTIADAILDRLMQQNHRLTLTGESLRQTAKTPQKEKNKDPS